ncbi:hypothetical protein R9X47_28310 [Wukongibacter baidiensis]|uniref:hypothetical protein n=1 Tax=Wukongibacter baidiensis TaxID=1723361 RepID=UPI003D7FD63C
MEYYDVIDCKIREKKTLLACGEGNGNRTFTPLSRGVWMFQKFVNASDSEIARIETSSFGFDFCECFTCCSGYLEYFVLVKPVQVEVLVAPSDSEIKATVSDGRIAVLFQEL